VDVSREKGLGGSYATADEGLPAAEELSNLARFHDVVHLLFTDLAAHVMLEDSEDEPGPDDVDENGELIEDDCDDLRVAGRQLT